MTKIIILPTTSSSSVIFQISSLSWKHMHFSLFHVKLRSRTIKVKTSAWNKLVSHWYGFDWRRGIRLRVKTWRGKGCQFSSVTEVTGALYRFWWKFYPYQLLSNQIFAKVTLRLFWLGFSRNYQIKIFRDFSPNFGCNVGVIQWTKLDLTLVKVLIPYSL